MLPDVRMKSNAIAAGAACLALAAALSAGEAGCGSGGGGPSTDAGGHGGSGGTPGSGIISWQDDGVAHQTTFATASLVTSSGIQILQVAGGEASGIGIAFGVSAMPTVQLGAFQCGPAAGGGYPITSFSYTANGVDPLFDSCTISVSALGAADGERASGAFSAVLTKTAGGTKAITAGVFNVPLNVTP
jgi:hypothetical protein